MNTDAIGKAAPTQSIKNRPGCRFRCKNTRSSRSCDTLMTAADRPCRRRQRQIHPLIGGATFSSTSTKSRALLHWHSQTCFRSSANIGFTIAHQYPQQLSPQIRHAVLGNIGTIISFRVGAEDAPYLAKEFDGEFDRMDLIRLANYRVYIKLMIDGTPPNRSALSLCARSSTPFS